VGFIDDSRFTSPFCHTLTPQRKTAPPDGYDSAKEILHCFTNGCRIVAFLCVASAATCSMVAGEMKLGTNAHSPGMILDLGDVSHYVKVTPQYSAAAISAVLPFFSKVAIDLDLPVRKPITQRDVVKFNVQPFRNLTVSVLLTNDWVFEYSFGYLHLISDLRGYGALQDPNLISRYFGEDKITRTEAIQLSRRVLGKLGFSLEDVFAEQEPRVTLPLRIGTNTLPHYEVEWLDPRSGDHSVDIHINGNTKQLERLYLLNGNLHDRSRLTIDVVPTSDPDWPSVNPEYAIRLIPIMFQAIDDYAKKLSLPILMPLTTNNVAIVEIHDNEGWPHADVKLTNGWHFVYRHKMVNGYYAPDAFFGPENRRFHIKDFQGKWNFTSWQATELVKTTLCKLNLPTNNIHMDFAPNVIYAAGDFRKSIPRLFFEWQYESKANDDLQSKIEAEVNADTGKLESLYYDDKAYWGSRPRIDVPISLKD
jgi:hypothetical protein